MNRDNRPPSGEQLCSPVETAERLDVSPSWLAKARMRGDGPRFVKIGRAVRYGDGAIQDYIRSRTRHSTSEDSEIKGRAKSFTANSQRPKGSDGDGKNNKSSPSI
jgi:hypothetical protein